MRHAQTHTRRTILVLSLLALVVVLVSLAACGGATSDKFAGTWVQKDQPSTQMLIVKNDDGSYTVKDPDGGNAWTTTPTGDTLKGTVAYTPQGASKPVDVGVEVTITGDTGKFTVSYKGNTQTMDIKRK